jgi:hypothetical protein
MSAARAVEQPVNILIPGKQSSPPATTKKRSNHLVRALGVTAAVAAGLGAMTGVGTDKVSQVTGIETVRTVERADAGVESCAGVIAAIGSGVAPWAAAAIAAPFCGAWLGEQNARRICWESRQWWGWGARAYVWSVTYGRYTRC